MANAAENEKWLKIEKWICQKWTPFVTLIRTESVEGMNKSLVWVKREERSGGGDSVNTDNSWGISPWKVAEKCDFDQRSWNVETFVCLIQNVKF